MNDLRKTKAQLAAEVAHLRSRVAALETAEAARQRAEAALHQSEASLRALLDAVDDSMMLIEPDGTVVAANATTAARLSTTPTTMLGHSVYDFVPAEVVAHRRQYVAQTVATGQPARFIDERRNRSIDNSIYPIKDERGQVVRLAIFGRDITVHTQTETALRQAVVKYQMLFNNFPLGITISDRTGRILETNQVAEALLGVPQAEHTAAPHRGRRVATGAARRDADAARRICQRARAQRESPYRKRRDGYCQRPDRDHLA